MKSRHLSLVLIALSFVLWGLLRSLDDVLIALFQTADSLRFSVAMLVHFSFFSAYALVPFPASVMLDRRSYRYSLAGACISMALGAGICIPGAAWHLFPLCLAGIFIIAVGIAILQTCANPCIGLLGPPETATGRLLTLQSFSSLGSALGPVLGAWLFLMGFDRSSSRMTFPSHQLAGVYVVLLALFFPLTWALLHCFTEPETARGPASFELWRAVLSRQKIRLAAAAVFLAVGSEATVLGHAVRYLSTAPGANRSASQASLLLSSYWLLVLAGRLLSARLLRWMSATVLLTGSAVSVLVLIGIACVSPGQSGGLCLLATGFFTSTIYPTVFSLSVADLPAGELAAASGVLTTAICGGALMPLAGGMMVDQMGLRAAFLLPLATYLLLSLFSHRLSSPRMRTA